MNLSAFEKYAKSWKHEDIIFLENEPGDKFYFIQEGKVRIAKIINDIEKTIDILEPGSLFGEMAILEAQPRSASAIAEGDVKLLEFTKENFVALLKMNPSFGINLIKKFTKWIFDAKRRLLILRLNEPELRIADCFLMLAEQNNISREQYSQMQNLLTTTDDIASWCGIHPNDGQKVLQTMVKQRKIEIKDDHIVVKNLNEFQRMVDSKRKTWAT